MTAATADGRGRAADDLQDVVVAIEAVDYNLLLEDDLRALLDAHETIRELCLRYRQEQHNAERGRDR